MKTLSTSGRIALLGAVGVIVAILGIAHSGSVAHASPLMWTGCCYPFN